MTAKEVSEDRWQLSDVVLPLPLPGSPVPESGGRLTMEATASFGKIAVTLALILDEIF